MRNAKLWSVLLAAVLLCACVAGVLFVGAGATDGNPYVLNVGGTDEYASVAAALDTLTPDLWETYDSVTVNINGTVEEPKADNSLLFGQETIWMADGTMVPITITGSGSLTLPAESIANANNITFNGLDMPISDIAVKLFAGSGSLTFDACTLGTKTAYRLYADNFTAAAFGGWDEADYLALKDEDGHIKTTLTLKNGSYPTADSASCPVAAVGSSNDYEATIGSYKISANNTKAELTLDGVTAAYAYVRVASNPVAESILNLNNCDVTGYRAAKGTSSAYLTYTGDITCNITGGTYSAFGRLLQYIKLVKDTSEDKAEGAGNGSLTLKVCGAAPTSSFGVTNNNNFIQTTWGSCEIAGDLSITYENLTFSRTFITHNSVAATVGGDYNLTIDGLKTGAYYNYVKTVGGDVVNKITGLEIDASLYKSKAFEFLNFNSVTGSISNELTDCTIGYDNTTNYYLTMGSNAADATVGNGITNTLKNVDLTTSNFTYVGGNQGSGSAVTGNITNTIDANCSFAGGFYGGNYNGDVTGDITNLINGGEFNTSRTKAFVAGLYTNGNVKGTIKNTINGGTFYAESNGYAAYMGSHMNSAYSVQGGIDTEINSGTFNGYLSCGNKGGTAGISNNKGTNLPAIKTVINDGTFRGVWACRGKVTGDIVTTIKGGNFNKYSNNFPNSFAGGVYRDDQSVHVSGNTVTAISGGTFEGFVYGGCVGNYRESEAFPGTASMTVTGGTFESDIFANSNYGESYYHYANAILHFDLTQENANGLTILGAVGEAALEKNDFQKDTFTVKLAAPEAGKTITIGKDTNMVVDEASGSVTLHQTEGWLGHDYFAAPENSITVSVTEEDGVYGKYSYDPNILLVKGGYTLAGTTLIFEERVGIRVLFNKDDVAAYENIFSYAVAKDGAEAFLTGTELETWKDPATGEEYDSFIIHGIGLSDFAENFTVSAKGLEDAVFSVYKLAEAAKASWTDNAWIDLAVAIQNLNDVYSTEDGVHDEVQYSLNSVTQQTSFTTPEGTSLEGIVQQNSMYASLLMSDAVGAKLTFTLADGYTLDAPVIKVNGQEIEGALAMDGQNVTITLLFNAKYMATPFDIQVANGETVLFTLSSSIEKLAYELAIDVNNSSQENAQALLYYIQKAVAVVGA